MAAFCPKHCVSPKSTMPEKLTKAEASSVSSQGLANRGLWDTHESFKEKIKISVLNLKLRCSSQEIQRKPNSIGHNKDYPACLFLSLFLCSSSYNGIIVEATLHNLKSLIPEKVVCASELLVPITC